MDALGKVFEQVAGYFSLLSEPTRLKILHRLCGGACSVNDLAEATGLTQANTSRHLNLLYRAGVVDRDREGAQVFYRIVDPNLVGMCRPVCQAIAHRADLTETDIGSLMQLKDDENRT
jgi:DNA-binding transcriptional ArsR family regulator